MQKQGINDEIKSCYWIGKKMSKDDIRTSAPLTEHWRDFY